MYKEKAGPKSELLAGISALRFSVVVDSCNYRDFVAEAIDSVLTQTYPAAEIIVVDDGSTDGTPDLLRQRYGAEARVHLILKDNGGQLSAFVAGVTAADGDVVCFLDADDAWEPDYLAQVASAYAHVSSPDFVFANARIFGRRTGYFYDDHEDRDVGLSVLTTYFHRSWLGCVSSAISMRLMLARRVLDLPEHVFPEFQGGGDNPLVFGASLFAARKRYLGSVAVRYRAHDSNIWLDRQRSPAVKLRSRLRLHLLMTYYLRRTGIGPESLRFAALEFETKPKPTAREFLDYTKIAWAAPQSLARRLIEVLRICRHYWVSHASQS